VDHKGHIVRLLDRDVAVIVARRMNPSREKGGGTVPIFDRSLPNDALLKPENG
jgi:hypothetical protein